MSLPFGRTAPEVWGGVECTVNRVGDRYFDQLVLTGHDMRLSDLDLISELGIRTLRYPVLWERVARGPAEYDWSWSDRRLNRLRDLGIDPIVGLVHHGSGPSWTSLVDESFVTGLTEFARQVARRYPWIRRFTVVNEPLTTARFSCLYGHWYPHERDDRAFVRALLNQCRASVTAMQAIRQEIPEAELVQTEDISECSAGSGALRQAQFYQERKWLSLDLLAGRVDQHHHLYRYLIDSGGSAEELARSVDECCPPDIVGLNYYVASDRYLDTNISGYPEDRRHFAGGEWFVDTEAVRSPLGLHGHLRHLRNAWERYQTPLAVTEVHLDCGGEDQIRWMLEAWTAANDAVAEGIDVIAITAWALFGAVDWNSLLTRSDRYYEPGAFDIRAPRPRRRALATTIAELAEGREPNHPAATGAGWWRRLPHSRPVDSPNAGPAKPILITGTGTLAQALVRACQRRGLAHVQAGRREVDITDRNGVAAILDRLRPWVVINACGYVDVDGAEANPALCWRENAFGPGVLACEATLRRIGFVTFSSDLVFDGESVEPYLENAPVSPLCVYGESKAGAERLVLSRMPEALVIRTAAFFGPDDEHNFLTKSLDQMAEGRVVHAADSLVMSPTYVPDLADATLELALDRVRGICHLTNGSAVSWAEFAREAAKRAGVDFNLVENRSIAELGLAARRPSYSVLASGVAGLMPEFDSALDRYVASIKPRGFRRLSEAAAGSRG